MSTVETSPTTSGLVSAQLATAYYVRAGIATLVASVWLVGMLVASVSFGAQGAEGLFLIMGLVVGLISIIVSAVYASKAKKFKTDALAHN